MKQIQRAVSEVALASQLVTDGATVTANVDMRGYNAATILVNLSIEETTHAANSTLSLLSCDTTVVTNFATVVANKSLDLTAAKQHRYEVDNLGGKRYLRLSFTAGTTTGGNVMVGAIVLKARGDGPASTTAMVASTNDSVQVA
jgi:hypothetical protein